MRDFGTLKNRGFLKITTPPTQSDIKKYLSGNRNKWLEITNVAIPFFWKCPVNRYGLYFAKG